MPGMFFEQFPALACRGIPRIAEPRESPHLGDGHAGCPESPQERQPEEVDLLVSTAVRRAPDRFDEAGSLVVAKRVDAQPGPLRCVADGDTAHGCQSRTWSALQVKPEIAEAVFGGSTFWGTNDTFTLIAHAKVRGWDAAF